MEYLRMLMLEDFSDWLFEEEEVSAV